LQCRCPPGRRALWCDRCNLQPALYPWVQTRGLASGGWLWRCARPAGGRSLPVLSPYPAGDCVVVSRCHAEREREGGRAGKRSYGVIGMLECLRAPKTALGVPAARDFALSPSDRGESLSSSRRNCWLFIVAWRGRGRVGLMRSAARVAVSEKFHQAKAMGAGALDSCAAG
jgi:hypothetical protein